MGYKISTKEKKIKKRIEMIMERVCVKLGLIVQVPEVHIDNSDDGNTSQRIFNNLNHPCQPQELNITSRRYFL